jgi:hypothetical protein
MIFIFHFFHKRMSPSLGFSKLSRICDDNSESIISTNYQLFRQAVDSRIQDFRLYHAKPDKCPMCGKPTKYYEIDHYCLEFRELLRIWLKWTDNEDRYTREVWKWKDDDEFDSWINFHDQFCKLQFLCHSCNKAKSPYHGQSPAT